MCLVIRKPPLIRFSPFSSQSSWNGHHWDTIGPADLVMYGTWAVANKARWSGTHPGCVSPCLLQCCLGTCGATKHCGRELPKFQLIVIVMPLDGFFFNRVWLWLLWDACHFWFLQVSPQIRLSVPPGKRLQINWELNGCPQAVPSRSSDF